MHTTALALTLLASTSAAVPPPAAAPASPSTQTSTSDSGADSEATAEAIISYFFGPTDKPTDAPLISAPRPDSRELPQRSPSGIFVGAYAHAEAHASSRSKSSSSSTTRPGDGRDRASNTRSSSRSRSNATAEARVVVIGPFADPNADSRFSVPPQRPPAERAREQALTRLAATKDWAPAVITLGQTYLENPELLNAPLDETSKALGMSIRELGDRAITLARRENKLPQWIAAAALLHADGRIESAKALLAKVKLADPADTAKLEDFRTTFRIRTTSADPAPASNRTPSP